MTARTKALCAVMALAVAALVVCGQALGPGVPESEVSSPASSPAVSGQPTAPSEAPSEAPPAAPPTSPPDAPQTVPPENPDDEPVPLPPPESAVSPDLSAVPAGVPAPPPLSAAAAILVDWRTGQILYAKDAYKPRAPASTTKILTAIVALESARLNEKVKVSRYAASTPGSYMPLEAGQVLTVGDLLWGMLLRSGNNACVAVAEHIAGSEKAFVEMMNRRAAELGARKTHFQNPHGISVRNHYSTAYDLALLARFALTMPPFETIVRTREASLYVDGGEGEVRLRNTNSLLWSFTGADGVKTGTTDAAGKCLVASATRDGRRLLSVVLNAPDRYGDTADLLEWGFKNFSTVCLARRGGVLATAPVRSGMKGTVDLAPEEDFWVACPSWATDALGLEIHLATPVTAPLRKGQVVGVAEATLGDGVAQAANLVAQEDVPVWTMERWIMKGVVRLLGLMAGWGVG